MPFQLNGDEGEVGVAARAFFENSPSLLGAGWSALPQIGYWETSLWLRLFGDSFASLRAYSAFWGVLSIIGTYFLARQIRGRRFALLVLSLISVYPWHVHYSRIGIPNIQVNALAVWSMYFFLCSQKLRSNWKLLLSGLIAGLGWHGYAAGKVIFVPLLIFELSRLFRGAFIRIVFLRVTVLLIGVLISAAPTLSSFLNSIEKNEERERQVFVFDPRSWDGAVAAAGSTDIVDILSSQTKRVVGLFIWGGDSSPIFSFMSPLISTALQPLFLLGVLGWLISKHYKGFGLVVLQAGITIILGGILTVPTPFSQRMVAASSLLMMFPALGMEILISAFSCWRPYLRYASWILVIGFVIQIITTNLTSYFIEYPEHPARNLRDISLRILQREPEVKWVFHGLTEEEYFPHGAWRFAAPQVQGVNVCSQSANRPMEQLPDKQPGLIYTIDVEDALTIKNSSKCGPYIMGVGSNIFFPYSLYWLKVTDSSCLWHELELLRPQLHQCAEKP